jgi:alcohol dehydrogenase class IV
MCHSVQFDFRQQGQSPSFEAIRSASVTVFLGTSLSREAAELQAVAAVCRLVWDLEIPSLRDIGIREEDIPTLSRLAAEDPHCSRWRRLCRL